MVPQQLAFTSLLLTVDSLADAGVNAGMVLYGIASFVFVQCIYAYLSPRTLSASPLSRDRGSPYTTELTRPFMTLPRKIQLLWICLIFASGSLFLFASSWVHSNGFIERTLGGGVFQAISQGNLLVQPGVLLGNVSFLLTGWLANGFMLYRCYTVYSTVRRRWVLMCIPVLLYLGSSVTTFYLVAIIAKFSSLAEVHKLSLATFSLATCLNISTAALISSQILTHRIKRPSIRNGTSGSGKSKRTRSSTNGPVHAPLTSLVSILVESGAIHLAFSFSFTVQYVRGHPSTRLLFPILGQIQIIVPLLIGRRISKGTTYTAEMDGDKQPSVEAVLDPPRYPHPDRVGQSFETYQTGSVWLHTFDDDTSLRPNDSAVHSLPRTI